MTRLIASFVLASNVLLASGVQPRLLEVSIEQAITIPGHDGKGALSRPLTLIVSNWQSDHPAIEAYSLTGAVWATCVRLKSPGRQWNADVGFDVIEAGHPRFSGSLKFRLTIDGTIVHGHYEGDFNGIPMSGSPGAGLMFEHAYPDGAAGLSMWLPRIDHPVRGILIWGNGANLDNRYFALHEDFQAFAAANDLAVVASSRLRSGTAGGQRLLDGLGRFAIMSGHTELERVPIFMMGHSNGGFMASSFNAWAPDRVMAFVASHGFTAPRMGKTPLQALANPGILATGEVDPKVGPVGIESLFVWQRLEGAHVALIVEQGGGHEPGEGSAPLFLFTLQHVLNQRLPTGASQLLPVDERGAWLADNATWKDGITAIASAAETGPLHGMDADVRLDTAGGHVNFKAVPQAAKFSWLPDKDVAWIYRGAATYSNPLKLARVDSHSPAYLRNEPIQVECTAFGDGDWKSIGVYDGAVRIGEITKAAPRLTLPVKQKPGAHAGVLVGELRNGELRTSLPISWVVWP